MKHLHILTFLILSSIYTSISAQSFKGKITDKSGEPLYGSSIYIKEANLGLVCNDEGFYQTNLASGSYNVEYKCLGFKRVERKILIKGNEPLILNITLDENPYTLSEVTVSNNEDPAYPIMRKAIEKAPLYTGAIKEYTADVYIKGNGEILKVASLVDRLSKNAEGIKLSELLNQVFVQESFSEVQFISPDKYKQNVKAFSSSIPDNVDAKDAMGIIQSSLYMPKSGMFVSPLNPKAFTYYRFRYEGFFEDGDVTINKIKVEPKMKDPILYSGYIYIADNTWHIYSAELTTNVYGVKEEHTITYQEVKENAFLPISYLINSDIDVLGNKFSFNYYASLKYKDIETNKEITKELTEKKKSKKRDFEIKRDSLYKTESDSLATKRDSAYWASIRVIPLEEREVVSYVKKDSIQQRIDSIRKEHHNSKFSFKDIFEGGKIGGDSTRFTFKFDGLLLGVPEYNFVDGLWLGQKFDLSTKVGKNNRLSISPYIYYTTSRKRLVGGSDINLLYSRKKMGELIISGGSVSEDFNPTGIHRFNNATNSLIKGRNYNHFYQNDYISISNNIELTHGLTLITSIEAAKRSGLSNHTDYTWGRKDQITPNMFSGDRFDRTAYNIGLNYTPYVYYTVADGVKKYQRADSPTFFFRYSEAFGSWQTNNSKYRKLRLGIYQQLKISEFSRFNYNIEGGGFLGNKDKMHFADFQQFSTADITINLRSPFTSFMLLDNYTASTNKHWLKGEFNYDSNYLLLKRLPFLQGKMFTESLHLKNLYTPDMRLYSEVGYSINVTHLLNFGAFASFNKAKYQDFGIRVLFDLERSKKLFK